MRWDHGSTGPTGPAGTANVIYSDWFTPPSYTLTTDVLQMNVLTHDQPVAEITQELLDTGAVLVFGKLNGYAAAIWPNDNVGQLPISVQYALGQLDVWTAKSSVGNLQIHFVNNTNLYSSINTAYEFRYVIIPGGVALGDSVPRGVDLHSLSYEEVLEILGIPKAGARF